MGKGTDSIFISYRRAGTSGYGGRLQEDLRHHFGRDRVFRDIDSIRPGSEFAQVIEQAVARSSVVLALIGSTWLEVRNESGQRRLDDPEDFVRLEIESALSQGILVIPVLVEGAAVPSPSALPSSLSRLGRMQAIELSDQRWDYDVDRLVQVLEDVIAAPAEELAAPPGGNADGPETTTTGVAVVGADPAPPATEDVISPAPAPTPRRRRRLVAVALGLAVLIAVGLVVAVGGSGAAAVELPNVIEKDAAAATKGLQRAGFVVRAETELSDGRPDGIVVGQDPAGGALVKKGTKVTLVVTEPGVPVPSLLTLGSADAVAAVETAGLVAVVVEQQNPAVPAGTVFLQTPDPSTAVVKGSTVSLTVSTGTTTPTPTPPPTTPSTRRTGSGSAPAPAPGSGAGTGSPGTPLPTSPTAPTAVTTPESTPQPTAALPPISTGNLVVNPGAEDGPESAPFSAGQPPSGWQRGADQAIAVAYGATGQRESCWAAGYPSVSQLQGSGRLLFTGGYGGDGGCGLNEATPTLSQVISLGPWGGRTDGLGWQSSVLLGGYPGQPDGASLTVEVLSGSGQVLASATTGVVSNPSGSWAFQARTLQGSLPAGAASVRLILAFPFSVAYSAGFADDVSFRLG